MADEQKTEPTASPKKTGTDAMRRIEGDAAGQFAKGDTEAANSGLHSANPRVISGDGRAPGYSWDERPDDPEKRTDKERKPDG